ncbi:hypothetical protein [Epilithonimonas hungarica]|uniref:Uncharacterized protein n=1 Tax=Epilithonimonas hungarica TaxID=454006 RepID=A0A1G7VPK6_9FLAO|nr:hypothetical protein [Epilithonimonas hungarica]SDG61359.1 hypothetical protein SAMN05421825_3694 [Epilithonimonas hungarica]
MRKKDAQSYHVMGMTKKEVQEELGNGFNFYPADVWHYELSKTWWGIRTVLFLEFENDRVNSKYIRRIVGKINTDKHK